MSALLERAKAHYSSLPRHEIGIPEWGETPEKPAIITWSQLTVHDQDRIYAPDSDGRPAKGGTVRMRAVILKACDESGKRLFDGMSEHTLRHEVDGDIIGRIANAILFAAGIADKNGAAKSIDDQIDDAKNV